MDADFYLLSFHDLSLTKILSAQTAKPSPHRENSAYGPQIIIAIIIIIIIHYC
jgi:hypothetical protein